MTRVVAGVATGAGGAGVGVGVDVGVVALGVGASMVAVGVGGGIAVDCTGGGPMSNPHVSPASAKAAKSPWPAAVIASAICLGPPNADMRHRASSRSPELIPISGPARSHSSSFRHAVVTISAAMLPAMALPGSPSNPAVMIVLGSMTSKAVRTQVEVSGLSSVSVPGITVPSTNPAKKRRSRVSSSKQPKSSASTSGAGVPRPASAPTSLSGSPMQSSSPSERLESSA